MVEYSNTTDAPDESLGFIKDIKVYDDAEDVKRIRFDDGEKTVEMNITDQSMVEFFRVAGFVMFNITEDKRRMLEDLMLEENIEDIENDEDVLDIFAPGLPVDISEWR